MEQWPCPYEKRLGRLRGGAVRLQCGRSTCIAMTLRSEADDGDSSSSAIARWAIVRFITSYEELVVILERRLTLAKYTR